MKLSSIPSCHATFPFSLLPCIPYTHLNSLLSVAEVKTILSTQLAQFLAVWTEVEKETRIREVAEKSVSMLVQFPTISRRCQYKASRVRGLVKHSVKVFYLQSLVKIYPQLQKTINHQLIIFSVLLGIQFISFFCVFLWQEFAKSSEQITTRPGGRMWYRSGKRSFNFDLGISFFTWTLWDKSFFWHFPRFYRE